MSMYIIKKYIRKTKLLYIINIEQINKYTTLLSNVIPIPNAIPDLEMLPLLRKIILNGKFH